MSSCLTNVLLLSKHGKYTEYPPQSVVVMIRRVPSAHGDLERCLARANPPSETFRMSCHLCNLLRHNYWAKQSKSSSPLLKDFNLLIQEKNYKGISIIRFEVVLECLSPFPIIHVGPEAASSLSGSPTREHSLSSQFDHDHLSLTPRTTELPERNTLCGALTVRGQIL